MSAQLRRVDVCTLLLIFSVSTMAAAPGPEQPEASVPPVNDRSAFIDYTPFRPSELAGWREVNDTARELGGHLGHMGVTFPPPSSPEHQHGHGGRP
ncbi:MAG: hypothetical protein ABWU16_04075 [Halothiobacillaceae bacterium]